MPKMSGKLLESLPILAFLGYGLFFCLICAVISGDARLLRIWFVSSPILMAAVLSLIKIYRRPGTGT